MASGSTRETQKCWIAPSLFVDQRGYGVTVTVTVTVTVAVTDTDTVTVVLCNSCCCLSRFSVRKGTTTTSSITVVHVHNRRINDEAYFGGKKTNGRIGRKQFGDLKFDGIS